MQSAQRLHHRLDAVMVGRDGEHAKGTDSGALLFETLDADFKRLFLDLRGRHYLDGRPGCMSLSVVELASEFPPPPA